MLKWILVLLVVVLVLGAAVLITLEVVEERERDEVPVPVVDVFIGYTDVDGLTIPAFGPNYTLHHTYVLAQDRETKDGFVTRAGPGRRCDDDDDWFESSSRSRSDSLGSGSGNSCPLFCMPDGELPSESKLRAHSFQGVNECETETLYKQHVGTINRPLYIVADQMTQLATANNDCNNEDYDSGVTAVVFCTTPYNSNSYAFSVVEKLTGRRPSPEFGSKLSFGQCEYERAHGWNQVVDLAGC